MKKVTTNYYELSDILTFGKYKDMSIENVIVFDSQYITWCLDNVEGFNLDEQAMKYYKNILFERQTQKTIQHYKNNPPTNSIDPCYFGIEIDTGS